MDEVKELMRRVKRREELIWRLVSYMEVDTVVDVIIDLSGEREVYGRELNERKIEELKKKLIEVEKGE